MSNFMALLSRNVSINHGPYIHDNLAKSPLKLRHKIYLAVYMNTDRNIKISFSSPSPFWYKERSHVALLSFS